MALAIFRRIALRRAARSPRQRKRNCEVPPTGSCAYLHLLAAPARCAGEMPTPRHPSDVPGRERLRACFDVERRIGETGAMHRDTPIPYDERRCAARPAIRERRRGAVWAAWEDRFSALMRLLDNL